MDLDTTTFDVTTLRGRRATARWERTSVGDVFERMTWSHPEKTAIDRTAGRLRRRALPVA